ncbi:MAG: gliding motility lipoprotein GldD [Bacteroidetes bacterium GWE2_41_25]|nr:MAG: gliding motility lipoprotein GldD [Bacteroidetes bacterium GWA2_40_15]OFX97171.1 MAG: gliding motility lipoprotein GldD [Bacteroidetes bacterium GWC2_40_22]OFY05065.1 MAG: gliding motility lipoprotein GldD [Bacteroidetes bacterium GWE2_41_25]OFY59336.1 MAG: gliding motility lipoprotein GldD [Bacteroidetes bacterium GWF2_41_9]HAM10751.1 gliding motility lipoprotein GldD [Bacteroidales bacterium]
MKLMQPKISLIILLIMTGIISGCREVPVPKPRGHFRIDMPQHRYTTFNSLPGENQNSPFTFEYPAFGNLSFNDEYEDEKGWFNIEFPAYKAKLYMTYKNINNDFDELMEQTYKMNVKNHISKADAISEKYFNNEQNKVYGILYDLKGNTATAVQFYMTDSTNHFLRGSLYFASEPDADSLEPVIGYFREDIIHLIETLNWKE